MLKTVLMIILSIISIALIVIVLMQEGRDDALGALAGGQSAEQAWVKNKGRSKENRMRQVTIVLSVAFAVLAVVAGCV